MSLDYFSTIKKIFFIGIGGIGISALAKMVSSRGIEVSGVNDEESPKTLDPLRELGAKIFYLADLSRRSGAEPASVLSDFGEAKADMYVYSDAWIHRGPEIIEA